MAPFDAGSAFVSAPLFNLRPNSNAEVIRRQLSSPGRRHRAQLSLSANRDNQLKSSPVWADGGLLSSLVTGLTRSPLYPLLRNAARKVMISAVEKEGYGWRSYVTELEELIPPEIREARLLAAVDPDVVYPGYYQTQFHGYDEGNLAWLPAFEAEPATMAISVRAYKNEPHLTCKEASSRLRETYLDAVFDVAPSGFGLKAEFTALDVGCGVGISTLAMVERLLTMRKMNASGLNVVGYDASPYMIAVAAEINSHGSISYEHGLGERCKRDDASVDWYNAQFLIHELPALAIRAVCLEAYRILRPGGVLSFDDTDPMSDVIQNLSPVLFTLMKSTEPYLDEYFGLDMAGTLRDVGFCKVVITRTSPRHRAIIGVK